MTTRTLVLLRHAKAEPPHGRADVDRPLAPRGREDAAAAGGWLAQHGYVPQLVLCSPARRTRETWFAVAPALPTAPRVRYDGSIYAAAADDLLSLVREVDDVVEVALLIGHNPGISRLSALLAADPSAVEPMRTSGIAVHTVDTSWRRYGPHAAPLAAAHTARA